MDEKRERGLKKLPDGRWQWSFRDPAGKYHRHVVRTKTEARAYLEAARTKIREGKYLDKREQCHTTFEEAAKEFLKWSETNKRPKTYTMDKHCAELWKASRHFAGKALDKITARDVEQFKQEATLLKRKNGTRYDGENVSKRNVDVILARLKRMFSLCVTWGLCTANPAAPVKLYRADNRRVRFLTAEEEARLLEECGPDLRRIVLFALHTGARKGEILNLRWQDVDAENTVATIPGTKAKGGRDRYIHLNDVALEILEELRRQREAREAVAKAQDKTPPQEPLVFGNSVGNVNSRLDRHWREALAKAIKGNPAEGIAPMPSLEGFRFHDLRHTYASRLVMAGVDLAVLRELLGHSDFAMTLRYAHLSPSRLKAAVAVLAPKSCKLVAIEGGGGEATPSDNSLNQLQTQVN